MDRIKMLMQFASEEPGDPFNLYALALEYLKVDPQEARAIFEKLLISHADYLPAYYPFAQLLSERKDHAGAERVYVKGMEIAKAKGDHKTLRELQSAYQDLLYGI